MPEPASWPSIWTASRFTLPGWKADQAEGRAIFSLGFFGLTDDGALELPRRSDGLILQRIAPGAGLLGAAFQLNTDNA